ncbi:MAG: B12-binding domain-containing radical SAM protein [Candidatus Bathyarchaeia archaeon]
MPQDERLKRSLELHSIYPPLGLAYVAAVLRENGADVKIIDANSLDLSPEEVTKMVERDNPDFVGIRVVTPLLRSALYQSEKIKEACPDTKIVLGGPHIHFEHREVIKNEFVDFCVRGEGEITLSELIYTFLNGGDLKKVRCITFKMGNDIYVTPNRPPIQSLDALPHPAWDLLPLNYYRKRTGGGNFIGVLATRGCPFGCDFCSVPPMWGRLHRRRSVENILDEIEHIYRQYKMETLMFHDDLLVVDNKWAIELCRGMVERGLDKLKWRCNGRVGVMTEELLNHMKKANCRIIFYGIEFGNQRILDLCGKGFTVPEVYKTVDMTKRAGIASYGYFMMGYPTETRETIEDTVALARDLVLNHGMDYAGFSIVTPYPGTPLYEYCRRNDLLRITDWSEYTMLHPARGVIKLRDVTEEELLELYRRAHHEVRRAFDARESLLIEKIISQKGDSDQLLKELIMKTRTRLRQL